MFKPRFGGINFSLNICRAVVVGPLTFILWLWWALTRRSYNYLKSFSISHQKSTYKRLIKSQCNHADRAESGDHLPPKPSRDAATDSGDIANESLPCMSGEVNGARLEHITAFASSSCAANQACSSKATHSQATSRESRSPVSTHTANEETTTAPERSFSSHVTLSTPTKATAATDTPFAVACEERDTRTDAKDSHNNQSTTRESSKSEMKKTTSHGRGGMKHDSTVSESTSEPLLTVPDKSALRDTFDPLKSLYWTSVELPKIYRIKQITRSCLNDVILAGISGE